MKPSLTFILPILILLLWGCSSSPVVKNINVSNNSEQIFIDSKINNQVAISDKDKRLLRNILNNLFLYKGLNDGDLIILEAYIEKDYIKKVALSEIALVISNNIKLRKSGKLEVSYVTNKINKEYLIESLLKKNYPFEVSFNSGYKIDADLVGSNLKYFCSSLMLSLIHI